MKKAIVILFVVLLASCEKHGMRDHEDDDDDMKKCESVTNEAVPTQVQSAFKTKYPQNTAEKWFNKDGKGFTAVYTQNGTKMLSQFDNDGTFKTENVAPPANAPAPNHPDHPEKGNHHGHHGLFGFGHPKHHHGNCNRQHEDSKETECHVKLVD